MTGCEGSNPSFSAKYAQIAQSVEQGTENPRVGGSIPPLGTRFSKLLDNYGDGYRGVVQLAERRSPKPDVAGSNPVSPAKSKPVRLVDDHNCPSGLERWNGRAKRENLFNMDL